MKNLIATVDEDFAQIDRLLKELRKRIARAAEAVHVVAETAAHKPAHRGSVARRPATIRENRAKERA